MVETNLIVRGTATLDNRPPPTQTQSLIILCVAAKEKTRRRQRKCLNKCNARGYILPRYRPSYTLSLCTYVVHADGGRARGALLPCTLTPSLARLYTVHEVEDE